VSLLTPLTLCLGWPFGRAEALEEGVNETRKIFVLVHYLVAVTHFARKSRLGLGDAIEAEKPARRNEQEHNKERSSSPSATTTENRRLPAHR
jgi:hypothetical protein